MDRQLLQWLKTWDGDSPAVFCAQISWKGSVPRKDFPHMIVLPEGKILGTIGGGWVEHEVIQRALEVQKSGVTLCETFDLTSNDIEGDEGVCGGTTRILIQRFDSELRDFWLAAGESLAGPSPEIAVTWGKVGETVTIERTLLKRGEETTDLPEHAGELVTSARKKRKSLSLESWDEFYLAQWIAPPPKLHLFGAGHVGKAVADLADFIEVPVCVYDDRPDLASEERFPYASCVDHGPYASVSERADVRPEDFVVIATHGHQHDLEMLRWLIPIECTYLGLMSSRKKAALMQEALEKEGFTKEQISRVNTPIGFNIGAETVPEIAVSIIAEVIQELRAPGSLAEFRKKWREGL